GAGISRLRKKLPDSTTASATLSASQRSPACHVRPKGKTTARIVPPLSTECARSLRSCATMNFDRLASVGCSILVPTRRWASNALRRNPWGQEQRRWRLPACPRERVSRMLRSSGHSLSSRPVLPVRNDNRRETKPDGQLQNL